MPTYEYVCRACGDRLEVVQAFTDDSLTTCPKCGNELRKIFGNVGIVLKGSGFYKTDNRAAAKSSKTNGSGSKERAGTTSTESAPTSKEPASAGEKASAGGSSEAKSSDTGSSSETRGSKSASGAAVGAAT
jgi:putative FmdB family regulatory protein